MSEKETTTLCFSIDGQFITKTAREKLLYELDIETAIELLTCCMQSDQLSSEQINGMALKILDGQAELKGTYPNEDYGYVETPNNNYLLKNYTSKIQALKENKEQLEEENEKLKQRLNFIEENVYIGNEDKEQYAESTGDTLFDSEQSKSKPFFGKSMLDEFIQASKMSNNYGWLSPSGEFYPVNWSEHTTWAANWLLQHSDDIPDDALSYPTDVLTNKGWVLLHNPGRGLPIMTKSPTCCLTKRQTDFLYTFFKERNMTDAANRIMQEEYDG